MNNQQQQNLSVITQAVQSFLQYISMIQLDDDEHEKAGQYTLPVLTN